MREDISDYAKEAVEEFRKLGDVKQLYFTSIILNHLNKGLINEENRLDSDEAYDNDELVLEPSFIGLENDTNLATKLLLVATEMENISINPNGEDIEPYVKDINEIKPMMSKFYGLEYKDKIDFLAEIIYDISTIENTKKTEFDFNGLIDNILTYRKETFGGSDINPLEID